MLFRSICLTLSLAILFLTEHSAFSREKSGRQKQEVRERSVPFTVRWRASALRTTATPFGPARQKVLERVVRLYDGTAYGIGQIVYAEIPKRPEVQSEEYSPRKSAEKLFSLMRIRDVRYRRVGRAEVAEGFWPLGGRFIRVMAREEGRRFRIATGIFRTSYLESVSQESEWIQRALLDEIEAPPGWMKRILSQAAQLLIPDAQAQAAPCPACGPGSNPWQAAQCAACTQNNLLQSINGINQTLNGMVGQAANANQNWANTNNQLAGFNQNWANTNNQLAGFNQNWADTNTLLGQALDPSHMFVVGLATGAGAAVGSAAIGLLSSGFSELASAIHEAVTHEQRDAALLRNFDLAMEKYAQLGPEIRRTEGYIDSSLSMLRMARDAGGREALILHFNERIRLAETFGQASRDLEIRASSLGIDNACFIELNRNGARFDSLVRQMNLLREKLEETSFDSLCTELDTQIRAIIQAEQTLEEARARIIHPLTNRVVADAHENRYREALRLADEANNPEELRATRTHGIRQANDSYEEALRSTTGLLTQVNQAYQRCIDDVTHLASPVTGFFASWPLVGAAVRAGTRVELPNGETISAPGYCRRQIHDPESHYAEGYRDRLAPLVRARTSRIVSIEETYRHALRTQNVTIDPSTFAAARATHLDFVATLREQANQQAGQEMRMDALLMKQGEIRALCPMLPRPDNTRR